MCFFIDLKSFEYYFVIFLFGYKKLIWISFLLYIFRLEKYSHGTNPVILEVTQEIMYLEVRQEKTLNGCSAQIMYLHQEEQDYL